MIAEEKCPICGYVLSRKDWGNNLEGKKTVRVVCEQCGYEKGIEVQE